MITKTNTEIAVVAGLFLIAGCSTEPDVSYQADVKPVIDKHCKSCHTPGGQGLEVSGLSLESYDDLMKGTKFGPIVIAGDSMSSALNILVEGRADESIRMPHEGSSTLTEEEVQTLKLWVDQGAQNN